MAGVPVTVSSACFLFVADVRRLFLGVFGSSSICTLVAFDFATSVLRGVGAGLSESMGCTKSAKLTLVGTIGSRATVCFDFGG